METHPLEPFLPAKAAVLMMGSFPPPRAKWKMNFYYPNFQNDMWRIFGMVFFNDKDHFLTQDRSSFQQQRIEAFLSTVGIAVCDAAKEVFRRKGNASDNFLDVLTPIDLKNTLEKIPDCRTLVTTGEKATETLRSLLPESPSLPPIGGFIQIRLRGKEYRFYRMPSSSRAYPKPLAEKAEIYRRFFREIGILQ